MTGYPTSYPQAQLQSQPRSSISSIRDFAEKLSVLHPQPNSPTRTRAHVHGHVHTSSHDKSSHNRSTPRVSRDWSAFSVDGDEEGDLKNGEDDDNDDDDEDDYRASRRTSIGLPTPLTDQSFSSLWRKGGIWSFLDGRNGRRRRKRGYHDRGNHHRRQLSLSSFSVRGLLCAVTVMGVLVFLIVGTGFGAGVGRWFRFNGGKGGSLVGGIGSGALQDGDDGGVIPAGQSRERGGREVFWWEQFERLTGFYRGWKDVVPHAEWMSEQKMSRGGEQIEGGKEERQAGEKRKVDLIDVTRDRDFTQCYVDEEAGILPPKVMAYNGLPTGFPAPMFGSYEELGLRGNVCYDRINRFGPYGFGFDSSEGGLDIGGWGDIEGFHEVPTIDYRGVQWAAAQENCLRSRKYTGPRTVVVIRTWHGFEYTPYHIMMLRAMVSELSLTSGGRYTLHFLIHVQNDSLPIWASDEVYNQVLNASLPAEFAGMGTLWSVAQMKLIYPPPFPESIVNFSGDDIYKAYRSLHFPLQYFAERHPEFEYFWHWEMDMRVTGGYLELLEQITRWAEMKERDYLWETSSTFFIPEMYEGSYSAYEADVRTRTGKDFVKGPQLLETERLSIPEITDTPPPTLFSSSSSSTPVDLITFSPLFDPTHTRWAFHDDITGYIHQRPPTRAALITATRLSRRLLLTMHHETFLSKHTMFPEMFPASIALHYGYKAVYAPLPVYFDRDWVPASHIDEVFNNAPITNKDDRAAGMEHGGGKFHGDGGSVFGPGEHVFRGATWYSNADFAGRLWRSWLGGEGRAEAEMKDEEGRVGGGRMCLPMMVLHPIKFE